MQDQPGNQTELSVVMPCLNEAETLQTCIAKALGFMQKNGIAGEVIIADNGSTDGSHEIAVKSGARLVHVAQKGYGSALMGGIGEARGKYIIMGDADDSYDFSDLMPFVEKLREGYELVMGNRFKGGIKEGAMPFLHRYLGNPVLSSAGRLFFRSKIGDFHCGLRGFTKEAYEKMNLNTEGMEFASEMVVKASLFKMKIAEVPIFLYPDGRTRKPHLRTWRDGWRHLRFLLIYSPRWLFLYPGIFIFIAGMLFTLILSFNPIRLSRVVFDVHSLVFASTFILLGFQFIFFYLITRIYAINNKLLPPNEKLNRIIRFFSLERGLMAGLILFLAGLGFALKAFSIWSHTDFGSLNPSFVLRLVIPASSLIILGIQFLLYSFYLSILGIRHKP